MYFFLLYLFSIVKSTTLWKTTNAMTNTKNFNATDPNAMSPPALNVDNAPSLMYSPVSASTKDESSFSLGNGQYRRVPCIARGVQGDHDARTAYFNIPHDAKHGMLLACSHPACCESGRRFNYCTICKLPVTQRDFIERHGHGLVESSRSARPDDAMLTTQALAGNKRHRNVTGDVTNYIYQEKPQMMAHHMVPPSQAPAQPAAAAPQWPMQGMPNPQAATMSSQPSDMSPSRESSGMKIQLKPPEFEWLTLLHNRPSMDNTEATSQWMEDVLQASEPSNVRFLTVTPPLWSGSDTQPSEEAAATRPVEPNKVTSASVAAEQQANTDTPTRFPCKARGVPGNHNAQNAYIDVPPNTPHGTIVICSHPVCLSSGRKFKYCSVCRIPVAKRNFSKRHDHGLSQTPPPTLAGVKEEEVEKEVPQLASFGSLDDAQRPLELELEVEAEVPKDTTADVRVNAASNYSGMMAQECQWPAPYPHQPSSNGAINDTGTPSRSWMGPVHHTSNHNASRDDNMVEPRGQRTSEEMNNEDSTILGFLMDSNFLPS